MGKRKGKCAKKNSTTKEGLEPENLVKAPHSFVIHRGHCGKDLIDLTKDFRKIMEPFTASQLKERKKNTIKDFVSVSGYLHVSHMVVFTETARGGYMRLARLPRGPTLTFKIHNYSLARDVVSSLRKQYVMMKAFQHAPLIVLNSFSGEGMHMKLMATMFQNMFPTINITTVKLKNIRRCVLMNYNPSTKVIDLRHYVIRATPVGLNRGTKKMIQGKIPNLNRCQDISEFFDKAALASESECEGEGEGEELQLPQALGSRGAAAHAQAALRLAELGPRLALQLIKVEDGLLDGEVLFHELVEKTDEEKAAIKKKREAKKKQKEKRRAVQEENVKRKRREKEELKQKALDGIRKKREVTESQRLRELAAAEARVSDDGDDDDGDDDDDDDAQHYRDQVGAEPDADLFSVPRKRRAPAGPQRAGKRPRRDPAPGGGAPGGAPGGGGPRAAADYSKHEKEGARNFHKKDGGRGFKNNREGGKKFDKNRDGRSFRRTEGPKKVFGGKMNKFKSGRGKGKGRK